MEHREIFAVILAAALVIIVIGVLGMVRSSSGNREDSEEFAITTERPPITEKTSLWDMIHDQQAAMTTTETETETTTVTESVIVTDEEGNAVTDEDGNVVTEPMPEPSVTDEAAPEEMTTTTTTEAAPEVPAEPAETRIEITIG